MQNLLGGTFIILHDEAIVQLHCRLFLHKFDKCIFAAYPPSHSTVNIERFTASIKKHIVDLTINSSV